MTEKPEKPKTAREQLEEIMLENSKQISALTKEVAALTLASKKPSNETLPAQETIKPKANVAETKPQTKEDKHETLVDALNCPECGKKNRREALKALFPNRTEKLKCVKCGEQVDEKDPQCPYCGGKEAE